jgi:6-phosphogluconolactonase
VLHISKTVDVVIKSAADFFVTHCETSKEEKISVALSGGSSPKKLFELLSSESYKNKIAWNKLVFFFGDERYVPLDHEQSNYRMARESLFEPLNIPSSQVFPVNTSLSPSDAAREYQQTISNVLGPACKFDLIWLGLGDDAHTASLFPQTEVLVEKAALVKEVFVKKVNQFRITFTEPLINRANSIAFLTYGESKSNAVFEIMKGERNATLYPAQLVNPASGNLHWFLDDAAAQKID